ncbi:hypothetical protein [Hymenobacter busanensis]|uniref:hypothetical protein n=1 Tax=Hymenobacter busanensis TaxID=2607656 RepID=UPI001366FB94|nr:hypothetical protein [Hymenobacter busanensis]QHJ09361.1 hypothetical protein GUY19_19565 [Hymenobacter busanensis]
MNTLKTRPQCLEAKDKLEAELDGYQNRNQNLDFQDRRDGRTDASTAQRLAKATSQVTYLTEQLANTGLSEKDRLRFEDQLDTATYQQKRLSRRATNAGGAEDFLAEVDADQVDAQVTLLSGAIAAVQARHDALPA